MRIYRSLEEVPADFGPSALTIGNFDGVHAGHRRIMRRVSAVATERGLKPGVLTFEPHPTRVVAPDRSPRLMTTTGQRCELMAHEGIEQFVILPFTPELARFSPEQFVRSVLVDRLDARAVLVGDNFRFGYQHAGNTARLAELGRECGFTTEIIPAITLRGHVVSSTLVRRAIEAGDVSRAARMLTHPFVLEGAVVRGFGIGSKQTVPTLNLAPEAELLPATGVYISRTKDLGDGREWPSVTNVGSRPTFDGGSISVETYLLEPLEPPSPRRIRVEFLRRMREERRFETAEALRGQILRDAGRAQAYFRRLRRWTPVMD
jgi:riboflavin kinase / FMN adenylyltransferase